MKNWHSLSIDQTEQALQTSAKNGLSEEEAAVRFRKYGPNKLKEQTGAYWYQILLDQFASLLILILVIAAGMSWFLGDVIDALAILAIVILNGLLGFTQEWKAQTALASLKKMLQPCCTVLRAGELKEIDAMMLVPGDVVLLENGNIVPADLRLSYGVNLKTDEASLTGESVPVEKDLQEIAEETHISGRSNMVWMGTHIVNGQGQGIVVGTAMETEFGRIAGLTGQIRETATRLQRQLAYLGKQLAVLALLVAGAMIVIGWVWGRPLTEMFMMGVSLAVSAVPEGLPAVVTITLALGAGIMARRKALLRHLQAAETLGATSVICTDKTGTLTQNEMTVQKIWLGSGVLDVSGVGYAPEGRFTRGSEAIEPLSDPDLRALLETGYKCNHARISRRDHQWVALGSATEAAFITLAQKAGLEDTRCRIVNEFSFNSTRKRMSVIEACEGGMMAHVKGAPEVLLSRCSHILIGGNAVSLTEDMREAVTQAYQSFAQDGLRTLALARRLLPASDDIDEATAESDLVFLGVTGMIDPPREEVRDAIAKTRSAGIRIIMMTGDSPDTALAIARQIGLTAEQAVTGPELANMSDEDVGRVLEKDVIFARSVPEDKYRIVKLLQEQDHLVAMTGDGVNDAPALKQADIGIAMGIRGTDVAKGAADMVLTDDNFASIVGAIEEGRKQYANIRKFVHYLTSSNVGETMAIFMNIILGLPLILLPIQILWVNLVTDSVTALSLSVEKAEGEIMEETPRPITQPILDKGSFVTLGVLSAYIALVTLGLFIFYLDHSDYVLANTAAFTGMVMMANLHTLNFRSLQAPLSHIGWFSNPWLMIAIISMVGLQLLAVYTPFLQDVLGTTPLSLKDWGLIIALALPLLIGSEIYKNIRFKHHQDTKY